MRVVIERLQIISNRKQKLHFICGEFAAIKRQLRWGVMRLAKKEALTDQYRKCLSMGFQITGWRL